MIGLKLQVSFSSFLCTQASKIDLVKKWEVSSTSSHDKKIYHQNCAQYFHILKWIWFLERSFPKFLQRKRLYHSPKYLDKFFCRMPALLPNGWPNLAKQSVNSTIQKALSTVVLKTIRIRIALTIAYPTRCKLYQIIFIDQRKEKHRSMPSFDDKVDIPKKRVFACMMF